MTTTRVRYREGQPLRAKDLADEQAYRLAMRRRHNIGGHGWGIVTGLALVAAQDGFWVQPGLALDGYGRELSVPNPVFIAWVSTGSQSDAAKSTLFERIQSPVDADGYQTIRVWLLYQRSAETPAQRGRWETGPDWQTRWREQPELSLRPGNQNVPRQPPETPSADLAFGPHQDAPDDSNQKWPVYLGQLKCQQPSASDVRVYSVDLADRPYVTLVGEAVTTPTGKVRLQIAQLSNGSQRFAISFPDESRTLVDDRLTIDCLEGTTLHSNLKLTGLDKQMGDFRLAEPKSSFRPSDVSDPAGLLTRLCSASDRVSRYVMGQLPLFAKNRIAGQFNTFRSPQRLKMYLAAALNRVIRKSLLYHPQRFRDAALRPMTRKAVAQVCTEKYNPAVNRMLLEDAFVDYIITNQSAPPTGWSIHFLPIPVTPVAAAPWQIYDTVVFPPKAPGGAQPNVPSDAPVHQLRCEIADPGDKGDLRHNRLVIGGRQTDKFVPYLTVQADGTTIIHGTLKTLGQVVEGPIQADLRDPRFAAALLRQTAQGLAAAATLEITLTLLKERSNSATLNYTVSIKNVGKDPILGIQLYESTMLDGVSLHQGPLGSLFNLTPGETKQLTSSQSLSVGAKGKVDLGVIALGIGLNNLVVQASKSQQETI